MKPVSRFDCSGAVLHTSINRAAAGANPSTSRPGWRTRLVACLLVMVVGRALAGTNAWTTIGPEGGSVPQLFFNQANPSIVYAATRDRFYRSVDGGRQWQQNTSPELSFVVDLAVDPTDSNRVYVLSSGIHVSTDAGLSFTRRALPGDLQFADRLLPGADGRTLYLIAAPRVFVSQDLGVSWEERTPIQPDGNFLSSAQVDLVDPNVVYASLFVQGAFITRDGGRSWQPLVLPNVPPPPANDVDGFAVSPRDPQRLYLCNVFGVFVTTDQGRSFTRLMSGFTRAVGVDFENSNILYAATDGGSQLQRSLDRGATWSDVTGNLFSLQIQTITSEPGPSSRVLVGSERGILSAETGGNNWVTSHAGINAQTIRGFSLSDTDVFASATASALSIGNGSDALRPLDINRLFIATRSAGTELSIQSLGSFPDNKVLGLLVNGPVGRSEDGGQHWQALPAAPRNISVLGASRGRPANVLVATTDGKLLRSADNGDTFEDVSARVPGDRRILEIRFARSRPSVVYATFETNPPPGGGFVFSGIYRSEDGGATFAQPPMPTGRIEALEIDPLDPQVVYVAGGGSVRKSVDGGATWAQMSLPALPTFSDISGLHVDPVRPKILYVSTFFSVLRSVNGGASWQMLPPTRTQGSVNQDVTTDPMRPGVVRVGTGLHSIQQMTISPDLAVSASSMPSTLPINAPIALTYTVDNLGPFDASGVGTVLQVPTTARDVRAAMSNGTCSVATGRVTCTADALLAQRPETITLNFTTATGGPFAVNAEVTANEPDTNTANNSVARSSTVAEVADLAVRLEGTRSVTPGGDIAYRLSAMNSGPSPASAVRLTFQLDRALMLGAISNTSSNLNCSSSGGSVTCDVATLASGQTTAVSLSVTPTSTIGMYQSMAQVSGGGQDPAGDNNSTSIVTAVAAAPPPPAPMPPPQPTPAPPSGRRGGGGGGAMAPMLLLALAVLAMLRVAMSRRRLSRYCP